MLHRLLTLEAMGAAPDWQHRHGLLRAENVAMVVWLWRVWNAPCALGTALSPTSW